MKSLKLQKLGQRGVTFIELLLVMGLLAIFLTMLVTIFAATVEDQSQTEAYSATISDGRFMMARLDYDIARSTAVSFPTSSSIVLTIGGLSYTYALTGGNLQLNDGTNTDNLNSNGSIISALSFQKVTNSGGKETVKYSFTVTSVGRPNSGVDSKTFTSTAERR